MASAGLKCTHANRAVSRQAYWELHQKEKVRPIEREDGFVPLSEETKSDIQRVAKKVQAYLMAESVRDAGGHIKETSAR
jgi:hypothetical protein